MNNNRKLKSQILARKPVIGAFIKTPHPIVIEVMGASGLDFLVIDAEHAPFDRTSIDMAIIAGRAVGCPLFVRVPTSSPDWLLNVLDAGAAGVMVPHVKSPAQAEELVRMLRYVAGGRGFAGTTRAAEYAKRSFNDHLTQTEHETTLICQIEDPEGVDTFEEISRVDGVDALFVGRADLAVSYGYDGFFAPEVQEKCSLILGANGSATGLYCAPGEDLKPLREAGASFFVVGSEHSLMSHGAAELAQNFKDTNQAN